MVVALALAVAELNLTLLDADANFLHRRGGYFHLALQLGTAAGFAFRFGGCCMVVAVALLASVAVAVPRIAPAAVTLTDYIELEAVVVVCH